MLKTTENKLRKIIKDMNDILYKYENRMPKVKGITGLSRSDIDTVIFYSEALLKGCCNYIKNDVVEKVLGKYGIDLKYSEPFSYPKYYSVVE